MKMPSNYFINKKILITVDLEDWFQVENFKNYISTSQWENKETRFRKNTIRILELLETQGVKATFFVLGWCAKRDPYLIKEILKSGHEIASHGNMHVMCSKLSLKDLREDLYVCQKTLEDITGLRVNGYRAPSFSVNDDVIEILKELGYMYDSSYNSFELNCRHGSLSIDKFSTRNDIAFQDDDGFNELPVSNIKIFGRILPWGGGGYFRLYPISLFKYGVSHFLKSDDAYLFYIHPWEIDPDQPRVKSASFFYKFRHYYNLSGCLKKLDFLIKSFKNCEFLTCSDYISFLNK
jgi:polysaccharide deacetylase family protein (PEP-CTERM system associated)